VSIGGYAVGEEAATKNAKRLRLTAILAEQVERVRMFGTAALGLAWVAEGRTDGTITLANKPWDTSAGTLIARESGAIVMGKSGTRHDFSSTETIAVDPGIADLIVGAIRGVG
jgi:myo-inositol-1(or 4)-monophosphatase